MLVFETLIIGKKLQNPERVIKHGHINPKARAH